MLPKIIRRLLGIFLYNKYVFAMLMLGVAVFYVLPIWIFFLYILAVPNILCWFLGVKIQVKWTNSGPRLMIMRHGRPVSALHTGIVLKATD